MPLAAFGALHSFVFYFSLGLFLAGSIGLISAIFNWEKETCINVGLLFGSFYLCVVSAEIFLRVKGVGGSYMEGRSSKYVSVYPHKNADVDFTIQPYFVPFLQTPEYKFPRLRNNFGFRDADFEVKKDSAKMLIQTYGDSFTEGDGAPQDSSYPSLLRQILKNDAGAQNISIQNFGVCGSDPGFTCKQLEDIGFIMQPNVAVITYTSFDFTADFLTRGGLERFKDGYWQALQGPSWEWLYAASYIFRLVANSVFGVTHTNFFLTEKEKETRLNILKPKWNEVFQRIALLAKQNHLKILLLKKPERSEVVNNTYLCNFSFFEQMVDTISGFKRFDLLPYYRDSVHMDKNNTENYYWPKDGHHNSTGYRVMAKGVYCGLQKSYPEIFTTLDTAKMMHE
ncbi:MAG: hypothetical protein NTY88_05915 [Bacteroidetes bacterium]|nr:hypothetical protein [Bacteroidota bacterium]